MMTLRELQGSRELLVNLTLREVRGKYKRTALGHGWSLLNPIASLLIFSVVFGVLLRASPPAGEPSGLDVFALWLAAGLLPWTFFSQALGVGMQALLVNAGLVKKVFFPRELLVASTVFSFVVTFAIELTILTALLVVVGGQPLPWLPLVAVVILMLTLFALGLALLLSISIVYFRDTGYLVAILLQLWFYLTPIVYPATLVDDAVAARGGLSVGGWEVPVDHLYNLNPMVRFVSLFRSLLYDNRMPFWQDWAAALLTTVLALVVGVLAFRRFSGRVAEEL